MPGPSPDQRPLPTGIVTFLFTDIEGSTRLLRQLGDSYQGVLEAHATILRRAITEHDGIEVNTEGDAFFAVFTSPSSAIAAATAAQVGLANHDWPPDAIVRVRMGIHSGEGRLGGDDYIGMDVHRAARIGAAAHGGQVLVSDATRGLLRAGTVELRDRGSHRLKDLETPERLFQLVIADLPGDFAPLRGSTGGRGNIPEATTSFIGRESVVAEIKAQLETARLVTITGPGGVGKTRLALRVAGDLAGELRDGAFFVPLDTLEEPELLPTTLTSTLGLVPADEGPLKALTSHLAERESLLVLDSFERIAGAAHIVDELLRAAPDLRVLATSQSPLGLYGEHEYPAPPLDAPSPARALEPESLLEYEAINLFVARARAAKPDFRLEARDASTIVELVLHLDGLPLAIELAAARIKLLTPKAILDRLERRLDLLSSAAPNIPERQRTLRGAIDWSYGLLAEGEQHFFDRSGVFAGGFGFETAESLIDPGGECGVDPFDALASLVEKSLLRRIDIDDQPRFSLLESIRQYALEHLEQRGESDLMHGRVAEHLASVAEGAEAYLDRADDQGWFARLDAEAENVRAALRWAVARGDAGVAQRIVGSMWRYWVRSGDLSGGSWWVDEVLTMDDQPSATHAKALLAQGSLAYWRVDYEVAKRSYEAALQMYRALGDESGQTDAAYNLGYAQFNREVPDWDGARASFQAALDGYRAAGNEAMLQSTLFSLGWAAAYEGRVDDALAYYSEARAIDAGDIRPLAGLATVSFLQGEHEQARAYIRESREQTRSLHDLSFEIVQLETLVPVEVADGRYDIGMQLLGAAKQLRSDIGGGPPRERAVRGDPEQLAREAIGDAAVDDAIATGAASGADEVFERALGDRGEAS